MTEKLSPTIDSPDFEHSNGVYEYDGVVVEGEVIQVAESAAENSTDDSKDSTRESEGESEVRKSASEAPVATQGAEQPKPLQPTAELLKLTNKYGYGSKARGKLPNSQLEAAKQVIGSYEPRGKKVEDSEYYASYVDSETGKRLSRDKVADLVDLSEMVAELEARNAAKQFNDEVRAQSADAKAEEPTKESSTAGAAAVEKDEAAQKPAPKPGDYRVSSTGGTDLKRIAKARAARAATSPEETTDQETTVADAEPVSDAKDAKNDTPEAAVVDKAESEKPEPSRDEPGESASRPQTVRTDAAGYLRYAQARAAEPTLSLVEFQKREAEAAGASVDDRPTSVISPEPIRVKPDEIEDEPTAIVDPVKPETTKDSPDNVSRGSEGDKPKSEGAADKASEASDEVRELSRVQRMRNTKIGSVVAEHVIDVPKQYASWLKESFLTATGKDKPNVRTTTEKAADSAEAVDSREDTSLLDPSNPKDVERMRAIYGARIKEIVGYIEDNGLDVRDSSDMNLASFKAYGLNADLNNMDQRAGDTWERFNIHDEAKQSALSDFIDSHNLDRSNAADSLAIEEYSAKINPNRFGLEPLEEPSQEQSDAIQTRYDALSKFIHANDLSILDPEDFARIEAKHKELREAEPTSDETVPSEGEGTDTSDKASASAEDSAEEENGPKTFMGRIKKVYGRMRLAATEGMLAVGSMTVADYSNKLGLGKDAYVSADGEPKFLGEQDKNIYRRELLVSAAGGMLAVAAATIAYRYAPGISFAGLGTQTAEAANSMPGSTGGAGSALAQQGMSPESILTPEQAPKVYGPQVQELVPPVGDVGAPTPEQLDNYTQLKAGARIDTASEAIQDMMRKNGLSANRNVFNSIVEEALKYDADITARNGEKVFEPTNMPDGYKFYMMPVQDILDRIKEAENAATTGR